MSIVSLKSIEAPLTLSGGAPELDVRGSVVGKVKLVYAENVLPTTNGYTGVHFRTVFRPNVYYGCDHLHLLYNEDGTTSYFVPNKGQCLILDDASSSSWKLYPLGNFAGSPSVATVLGRTFICWPGQGVFEYNKTAQTLAPIPLHGIFSSNLVAITSSYNYLIATDGQLIYWSSSINPQEFTPLLTTGAGSAIPQARETRIRYLTPATGGFHIHTSSGMIFGKFTSTEQLPWVFEAVSNAGGYINNEMLAPEFAITTVGLQTIRGPQASSLAFPPLEQKEVYSFVGLGPFTSEFGQEGFSRESQAWGSKLVGPNFLERHTLPLLPKVKLFRHKDKYLVLSISIRSNGIYDIAYVYDLQLKRFGVLNIPHVDVIGSPPPPSLVSASFQFLQFLLPDGSLVTAEPYGGQGKLVFSPIFSNFGKQLQISSIDFPGFEGTLDILSSDTPLDYSGHANSQSAVRTVCAKAFNKFEFLATAKYHTLIFEGFIKEIQMFELEARARSK